MHVTFTVDAAFLGGAERYVERIGVGLIARGIDVAVLAREPGSEEKDLAGWYEQLRGRGMLVRTVAMGLPFHPFRCAPIAKAFRALRPDLVHLNVPGPYDAQMGLLAPLARLSGARAVVATDHLPMVKPLWKRAMVRRTGYAFVRRVITVCHANVAPLVDWHRVRANRIVVIPNGVSDPYGADGVPRARMRADRGWQDDEVVVAFVGNILEHKGLARVIEALAHITDGRWRLVVAGDGPDRARCEALTEHLAPSGRIHFLGAINPNRVADILAGCDVLALPSRVEGMPYVILEAMAAECAVVASTVAGIPEQVSEGVTGLLVDAEDVSAIARALADLISDPSRCARFGREGRRRFKRLFSLEQQVDRTVSVYRDALGAGGKS